MTEEKILDIANAIGNTLDENGVESLDDAFKIVGTFIIQTTYMVIVQNPQLRPEINTVGWLDAIKEQILVNADNVRKIGFPPDMMAN